MTADSYRVIFSKDMTVYIHTGEPMRMIHLFTSASPTLFVYIL